MTSLIEVYERSYKSDPFFSSGLQYVKEEEQGSDGRDQVWRRGQGQEQEQETEQEEEEEQEEESRVREVSPCLAPIPEYEVWAGQSEEQQEYLRKGRYCTLHTALMHTSYCTLNTVY